MHKTEIPEEKMYQNTAFTHNFP